MGAIIFIIFAIVVSLSFLENSLKESTKRNAYWFFAVVLVLVAGLREVGVDPDSVNYEYAFHHYDDDRISGAIEYSYFLISEILIRLTNDVHIIFVFYAFFGVMLKFKAFRKYLPDMWFLPVVLYLSFIYELHEVTQIRTGIMSGLFLLAIQPMADRQWIKSLLLIGLGMFFHISAIVLIPLVFLSNKEMSLKTRMFWTAVIPASYVFYFLGSILLVNIPIPYIENKLENYEKTSETMESSLNVFSPMHLFTIMLFLYLMYFYETIKEHNRYFPLMMKIFAISIFSFTAFAFLPVLANRLSYLFRIVTIVLYCNIYYTIRPKWVAMLVVVLISLVYMTYTFSYIFGIRLLGS